MKVICTKPNAYIKQGSVHEVVAEIDGCYAIKIKQGTAYIRKDDMCFYCGAPIGIAEFVEVAA